MDISNYFGKDIIALIAVSLGNANSSVAFEIAKYSKLPLNDFYNKVHIVSFDREYLNSKINEADYTQEIFVHEYNQESFIKIFDAKKSIIIIDDLSNLTEFIPDSFKAISKICKNSNFVIILASMKTSREDIREFSKYFEEAELWKDSFMSNNEDKINIKLHTNKITSLQDEKIKKLMENCEKKPGIDAWKEDNHRNCKRFCNIVYPSKIQEEIEEASRTKNEDKYFKHHSPHFMITRLGGSDEFLKFSPKFKELLGIIENNPGRHIIYTSFDSYYGSDMLYALTEKKYNALLINPEYVESEKEKIINTWNSNKKHKVLIITTSVPISPKYVDHIHCIDNNLKEDYERIFDILKYENHSYKSINLTIHLHSCEKIKHEDEKIIDEYTFPVFYEYLSSKKNFWLLLLEKSKELKRNKRNRLEIKDETC